MRNNYIIKSKVKGLYWSNKLGWTEKQLATIFSKEEKQKFLYLPVEALGWVETSGWIKIKK
jgi:hypothetical protein